MVISDALITDYSSAFFDYLLTLKPIVFFAYDYNEYLKKRGFYYDYKEFAPGPIAFTGKDLIKYIENLNDVERNYRDKRIEIRNRFNKYLDGNSCERIANFLNLRLE